MKMGILRAELFRRCTLLLALVLFSVFNPHDLSAQYFISSNDPIKKWSRIDTKNQKVIFPRNDLFTGLTISTYLDTLSPFITRGLSDKLYKFPVLVHNQNILSNGLVTWTPRRMELYSVPSRNTFATQWLKQLVAHEYRHVAQMSTMNVGFTKGLSYALGEQAQGLVSMLLPGYFLEGDAVLSETLFSTFGRGRQPEFSIGYRAIINDNAVIFNKKNPDKLNFNKMVLGSFKDHVPDIYRSGYLLITAANRYYGHDFWRKALDYTGRYPYTIVPVSWAFQKYAKSSALKLTKRAFAEYKLYWDSLSSQKNSAIDIETAKTSYTTYDSPLPLNDTLIVSLKKDLDRTNRFVLVNTLTSQENTLFFTGYVTSRPIIKENTLYWTEYEPSASWGQKNRSVVMSTKLHYTKKGNVKHSKIEKHQIIDDGVFYVTAVGNREFAMVSYDEHNRTQIVITDSLFKIKQIYPLSWFDASFNGLTWDNKTDKIVGIVMNSEGMWIGSFNRNTNQFDKITNPSYVTVNNLSATDGKLYFNSIASGKDEVNIMDLQSKEERQLTQSQYGTISSSPSSIWSQRTNNDTTLLVTVYSLKGYTLASQKINATNAPTVDYMFTPKDYISIGFDTLASTQFAGKPIINLDTVNLDSSIVKNYKVKKYNKTANLFSIHSWTPLYIDVMKIMNERELAIGWGVNVMSQNLLSTLIVGGGLGYKGGTFAANATAKYTSLPVHFEFNLDYGGGYQLMQAHDIAEDSNITGMTRKRYLTTGGTASLPLNFSSGVNNRHLNLSTSFSYTNTLLLHKNSHSEGVEKLSFNLSYQSYKSRTAKELGPRLGYAVQLYSAINPVKKDFGSIYGVYGKGYLPGIMRNHSLQLSALAQYQNEGKYNFTQKGLFPLGAYDQFAAEEVYSTKLSYQAPLFYPDWGLGGIIYFSRISLSLIGDYSYIVPTKGYQFLPWRHFYTYGGGINFDVKVFRIGAPINFGIILYSTNSKKGIGAQFVFNLDI